MHTWTENPLADIWSELLYLASSANVHALLIGRTVSKRSVPLPDNPDTKKRALEVASCIRQAHEYSIAAAAVSPVTRPLLRFYEMNALAKALIVAEDSTVHLEDIRYHGLTGRAPASLSTYASTPSSWSVEREFAVVSNAGVFPHLARSVGDSVPPSNTVIVFRELIRCIPDLADLYHRHFGESSHCFYLYGLPESDQFGKLGVFFSRGESIAEIKSAFPEFVTDYDESKKHDQPGFVAKTAPGALPASAHIERGAIAGKYLVKAHSSGLHKPASLLFAAQHILSNIARYKPVFWVDVIEGRSSGAAPIVERTSAISQRRFANDVLNRLWNENFTFGSPGYMS